MKPAIRQAQAQLRAFIKQDKSNPHILSLAVSPIKGSQDINGDTEKIIQDIQAYSQPCENQTLIRELAADAKTELRLFLSETEMPLGSNITRSGGATYEVVKAIEWPSHFESIGRNTRGKHAAN